MPYGGFWVKRDIEVPEQEINKYYREAVKKNLSDIPRNREKALTLFKGLAKEYIDSPLSPFYVEMAYFLEKMVEEDRAWKEPADVSKLSLDEQINYYIYKLRDDPCPYSLPFFQPLRGGRVRILDHGNASVKLVEIGAPALPVLEKLLEDRRPIRHGHFVEYGGIETASNEIEIIESPDDRFEAAIIRQITGLSLRFYRYRDAAREIIKAIKAKPEKPPEKSGEKKE